MSLQLDYALGMMFSLMSFTNLSFHKHSPVEGTFIPSRSFFSKSVRPWENSLNISLETSKTNLISICLAIIFLLFCYNTLIVFEYIYNFICELDALMRSFVADHMWSLSKYWFAISHSFVSNITNLQFDKKS